MASKVSLYDIVGKGYEEFWNSKLPYRVVKGSRGSKKSKTTALWYIYNMMKPEYAQANLLVVRRYFSTLSDSCYADLEWAIHRLGVAHLWRISKSQLIMEFIATGSRILFRGLDDPLKLTSITVPKGVLCWCWIEEAYEIQSYDDFLKLEMSIRGKVPEGLFKQFTLTFNPWSERHWLKERFFDIDDPEVLSMTTTYKINEYLDDADIAKFNRMKMYEPRKYLVSGLGEWGVEDGLIFENVRLLRKDEEPVGYDVYGIDFGFTNDPTAFIHAVVDEERYIIYIVNELYQTKMTNQDIANWLKRNNYNHEDIICDSSEPKSIAELRFYGCPNVRAAKKGPDSVRAGISRLKDYEIVIDIKKCPNIYDESMAYRWARDRNGSTTGKPVDEFNHAFDALRYSMEGRYVPSFSFD